MEQLRFVSLHGQTECDDIDQYSQYVLLLLFFFSFVGTRSSGEGFSAVIESVEAGLGAPDPHQLAEMDRMAFKIKGETSESEEGSPSLSPGQ